MRNFPADFLHELCGFIFDQDGKSSEAHQISWLEVVFLLHLKGDFHYPVVGTGGVLTSARSLPFAPAPPTVAGRLGLVRRASRACFSALGLQELLRSRVSRAEFGIRFSLDGYIGGCDVDLLCQARELLQAFVTGRRVANVGALARPL